MILRTIDNALNRLTMYKVLGFGLATMAIICLLLSGLGILQLPFGGMVLSLLLLAVSCFVANSLFTKIWQVPANAESWLITAFILFFILPQVSSVSDGLLIATSGVIAMASKYIIAWQGKHIFNPAAFAAVAVGLPGLLYPTWWIGSSLLWPLTLIVGLLVVRKIRRFPLAISFALASITTIALVAIAQQAELAEAMRLALLASPLIFLGTIMLTEPATMPPLRRQQILFGVLVGLLYALPIKFGDIPLYPEMALLAGNLYAFAISPKYRLRLKLKQVGKVSDQVYDFVFTPDRTLAFQPGQYLEWTLGHPGTDIRGNRRTFTIASSPTEPEVRLGVKVYKPSSSFKQALLSLKPGNFVYAGQLAGNFTLPDDTSRRLVFIAGGIGITPFRSMLKYMIDTKQKRDIQLYYLVSNQAEIAYRDVLDQAKANGVKVTIITGSERLDTPRLQTEVSDYNERIFYISGPNAMVESYADTLRSLRIPRSRIKTDHFSGY